MEWINTKTSLPDDMQKVLIAVVSGCKCCQATTHLAIFVSNYNDGFVVDKNIFKTIEGNIWGLNFVKYYCIIPELTLNS